MIKNILVSGGCGFIGSNLSNFLIKKGYRTIIIDNLSNSNLQNLDKNIIFFKKNILNTKFINKILIKYEIDTIIHLAAKSGVNFKRNTLVRNNIHGTNSVLKSTKKTKVKNFIFSSSAAVYGGSRFPVKENKKLNPLNDYGISKKKTEKYVSNYCKKNKINFVILRLFNVIGFKKYHSNLSVFDKIYHALTKGKNFYLRKSKESSSRDFIFLGDVIQIFFKIIKKISKHKNIIYNCCNNKKFSIDQVTKFLEKKLNKKLRLKTINLQRNEILHSIGNNTLIKKKKLYNKNVSLYYLVNNYIKSK